MDAVLVLLGLPLGVSAVFVATRWPEWILLAALALTAFEGTIEAFAGRNPYPAIQLLLGCFVVGRVLSFVLRRRERLIIRPWLLPIAAYVVLTAFGALVADSLELGWHGFKDAAWIMLVGLVAGVTLYEERTRQRLFRGIVILALVVGGYGVFRWLVGPAEQELAVASRPGRNYDIGDHIGVFGSFGTRDALAAWTAISIPVCIAMATLLRGHWRWVATLGTCLCAVALLGSEVRSAAVAAIAAVAVVLVLQHMTHAKQGLALGTTFAAVLLIAGLGLGAYELTLAHDPERAARFENILAPEQDASYSTRQNRWPEAIEIAKQHPFGLGLATAGRAQSASRYVIPGTQNLDSSYLQVALEQGLPGLALFAVGLLFLLGGLLLRGVLTLDPERAALAIGACGALLVWAIMMYTSYVIGGTIPVLVWTIVGTAVAGFTSAAPQRADARYVRPAFAAGGSVAGAGS